MLKLYSHYTNESAEKEMDGMLHNISAKTLDHLIQQNKKHGGIELTMKKIQTMPLLYQVKQNHPFVMALWLMLSLFTKLDLLCKWLKLKTIMVSITTIYLVTGSYSMLQAMKSNRIKMSGAIVNL